MQVLAEEIMSFLKLSINLDLIYNHSEGFEFSRKKTVDVTIFETNEYFLLNANKTSLTTININSYIEFYGRIRKISNLKSINNTINFICSSCGIIYSRNCEHVRNHKSLNNYYLNSDKAIHCENSDVAEHKISKEYSDLKTIRFFQ